RGTREAVSIGRYAKMKIFLDTGHLEEIRRAVDLGVVDGVTTNPTLASKEGRPFRDLILEMCKLLKDGVVNAEVVSTDTEGMLREARELAGWHPNIVVKVPMTREGIRVNVTLVFSPAQALLAAKAGAYFVSPFLGRLDDMAENGLGVLREIMEMYRAQSFSTQVLAASLRHPIHVVEAAKM